MDLNLTGLRAAVLLSVFKPLHVSPITYYFAAEYPEQGCLLPSISSPKDSGNQQRHKCEELGAALTVANTAWLKGTTQQPPENALIPQISTRRPCRVELFHF